MSFQAVRRRYTDGGAPGGSLMYEMHWDELPMVGCVVMKCQDFRKQLQRMRRNGKAMIEILITRPDEYDSIGDGRPDEGLPITVPMRPDGKVSPSWYVRDRLRNYSGRHVVVMVDLRIHWSLTGPVYLTRRKTLAVRDEIQMGAWKAAYMFDDYTIVYHRVWDYGDFTPDRGGHKRTREDQYEVRGDHAIWDALVFWMCAPGFLPEFHPQHGRGGLREEPHCPGAG